jgi:predicted transport protein
MINENFRPLFNEVDSIKERMRNCKNNNEWQQCKQDYKILLATAKQIYNQYSTDDKYQAFKNRENSAIVAIHSSVKRLWENCELNSEIANQPEKVIEYYNRDNYQTDFDREVEYWHNELFPMAIQDNLPDFKVVFEYQKHLWEQYWYRQAMNPNIEFTNELRKHWAIYKKELKGEGMSSEEIAN